MSDVKVVRSFCETIVDWTGGPATKKYKKVDLSIYLMHMAFGEPLADTAAAFKFKPSTIVIMCQTVEEWRLKDEALDNWMNASEHLAAGITRCKRLAEKLQILPP